MDEVLLGGVMPNLMAKLVGAASAEDYCALASPRTHWPAAAQAHR
jgi:hypothetical protein